MAKSENITRYFTNRGDSSAVELIDNITRAINQIEDEAERKGYILDWPEVSIETTSDSDDTWADVAYGSEHTTTITVRGVRA